MYKWCLAFLSFASFAAQAQRGKPKPKPHPIANNGSFLKTSKDSLSYALGINIARNLQNQGLTNIDAIKMYKGLSDILLNKKPILTDDQAAQKVSNQINKTSNKVQSPPPSSPPSPSASALKQTTQNAQNVQQAQPSKSITQTPSNPNPINQNTNSNASNNPNKPTSNENPATTSIKEEGKKFLAQNSKQENVISMPEGWQYYILHQSMETNKPNLRNTVKCHYEGKLIDGTVFEKTFGTDQPISFQIFRVIKGWQLALTKMTVGSKWRIFLPSHLAFGDKGSDDGIIKPGATLIFDIELLKIEK